MYQLHAFNARGEQLSRYVMEYGNEHYSIRFAESDDYADITWTLNQYASGYTDAPERKRNRIAYFEILDGPYLLARAVRTAVTSERKTSIIPTTRTGVEIRPVVGTGESAREGDPRYSVESVNGGGYAAFFNGALIGAAATARDAYALARESHARAHPSPDQAASDAYQTMMADPFGPTDPHTPRGDAQSAAPARSALDPQWGPGAPRQAVTDALMRGTAILDAFAPGWENEINRDTLPAKDAPCIVAQTAEPEFTPNPYWGDVATYGVAVEAGRGGTGILVYRAADGVMLEFVTTEYVSGRGHESARDALRRKGYGSHIVNRDVIEVSEGDWFTWSDATQWPATSEKFSNGLAERLFDSNFPDGTMGDTDGFGHYSLFRSDCAVLSTDSQGFVSVNTYGSEAAAQYAWDTLAGHYERHCMSVIEDALPTGSCDGIFLIFDTARHNELTPNRDDILDHIVDCETCAPYRYVLDEF